MVFNVTSAGLGLAYRLRVSVTNSSNATRRSTLSVTLFTSHTRWIVQSVMTTSRRNVYIFRTFDRRNFIQDRFLRRARTDRVVRHQRLDLSKFGRHIRRNERRSGQRVNAFTLDFMGLNRKRRVEATTKGSLYNLLHLFLNGIPLLSGVLINARHVGRVQCTLTRLDVLSLNPADTRKVITKCHYHSTSHLTHTNSRSTDRNQQSYR